MAEVTKDFATLYQRYYPDPLCRPLDTHIDPFQIIDEVPTESEVEEAVRHLRPHKAGSHTHLCVEHFKMWLHKAYPGEVVNPYPKPVR